MCFVSEKGKTRQLIFNSFIIAQKIESQRLIHAIWRAEPSQNLYMSAWNQLWDRFFNPVPEPLVTSQFRDIQIRHLAIFSLCRRLANPKKLKVALENHFQQHEWTCMLCTFWYTELLRACFLFFAYRITTAPTQSLYFLIAV